MTSGSETYTAKSETSPTFKKPSVIINMAAGSASDITDDILAIFKQHDLTDPVVYLSEPEDLTTAFDEVKTNDTDLLVIYGGDGTCKAGAIVAREAGIPLIALPGGTMNMLPKVLYGTDDWQEALELALSQKEARWHPAGDINGSIFFCGAIIGDPIVMSEARESLRDGDVVDAVKQLPDIVSAISHGERFEFVVDGQMFDRDANVLHLSCPFMTIGATEEDAFELASVPQLSMLDLVGIGAKALTQDWRDSVHVKTTHAKRVEINGQGAFNTLLDGEPDDVSCPVKIELVPKGVRVLAPNLHTKAAT